MEHHYAMLVNLPPLNMICMLETSQLEGGSTYRKASHYSTVPAIWMDQGPAGAGVTSAMWSALL